MTDFINDEHLVTQTILISDISVSDAIQFAKSLAFEGFNIETQRKTHISRPDSMTVTAQKPRIFSTRMPSHRHFIRNGESGTGGTQDEGWLDISELQAVTGTWADETFPKSTPESIVAHFREEAGEFCDGDESKGPGDPEEAADCLLLLLHHAHKCGYSLLDEAAKKFRKNRKRKWATSANKEGYFKHTEEAAEAGG